VELNAREAHAAVNRGEALAWCIPPHRADVLKGITAHIPIYADATYLFIFRTGHGNRDCDQYALVRAAAAARAPMQPRQATLAPGATDTLLQAIFNPSAAMRAISCRQPLC